MQALIRFTTLIAAMIVIPWVASNPPPWNWFSDPSWVQAWGSIAAILVGFAYVGLQNHWQVSTRLRQERDQRRHVVGMLEASADDVLRTLETFKNASKNKITVTKTPGRDNNVIMAEELMMVTPLSCGSSSLTLMTRSAAYYANEFGEHTSAIALAQSVVTAEDVGNLEACAAGITNLLPGLRSQTT